MQASLVTFRSDGARKDIPLKLDRRFIIGRKESADLQIPLSSVSRDHAAIYFDEDDEELMIEDLGSSNGTYVNNDRVEGKQELLPGDVIVIGSVAFQVVIDGHPADVKPIKISREATSDDTDGKTQVRPSAGAAEAERRTEPVKSGNHAESAENPENVDSFFGFNLDDEDI